MTTLFKVGAQLFIGAILLFSASSCSKTPGDVIKKDQAELNGRLERLDAICAKAAAIQKLDSDKITLPAGAPAMGMNGICYRLDGCPSYYQWEGNVQLFSLKELQDPLEANHATSDMFAARELVWKPVKGMVKNGSFPKDKKEAIKALQAFCQWRYVVVLNIRAAQAPSANPQPTGGFVTDTRSYQSGTFSCGFVEGDALLFDLDKAEFLGGFPITARNSEKIESVTYGNDDPNKRMHYNLDMDLIKQIRKAIGDGIKKRVPAAMVARD